MNLFDLFMLLPFLILSAAAVLLMLFIAFRRSHIISASIAGSTLAVALVAVVAVSHSIPRQVTALFLVDGFALYYMGLIFAAGLAVAVLAHGYFQEYAEPEEEFHVLLLLACLGAAVLACSSHFASFFLGLEILSISLYALVAYKRLTRDGVEAGLKYLVLTATADAFLLFGMALVYAQAGIMDFTALREIGAEAPQILLLAGAGLIFVGIGFKLGVVPFHMWVADVYQGAPAPVTAFLATVSKGAVFALLFRYFAQVDIQDGSAAFWMFSAVSIASMFTGNILALLQKNVKRVLAYSSIAHLGYLLIAFLAAKESAFLAVGFYLTAYFVTTLGAFGVVSVLSTSEREAGEIEQYQGLIWRRPLVAAFFTAMLLSLAGIPLTAGFLGKFYVMAAGVGSALWLLVSVLVVNSVIGLFYYLRIVAAMFVQPVTRTQDYDVPKPLHAGSGIVFVALAIALIWLGTYPGPLIKLLQATFPVY
jgi:NADH-quinone oxidoreductase subunit N